MTIVAIAIHAFATWSMVGLIWFVQIVHYPGFAAIPEDAFLDYADRHVQRTAWVVIPPMLLELVVATVLVIWLPGLWTVLGAVLLLIIWASTALVQAPIHTRLRQHGYHAGRIRALIRTNWIRTIAWSLRAGIASIMLVELIMYYVGGGGAL